MLVAVAMLCTLQNDVIHAGYLALALLFFRRRETLRMERNRYVHAAYGVFALLICHLNHWEVFVTLRHCRPQVVQVVPNVQFPGDVCRAGLSSAL